MAKEIERKFLVEDAEWRTGAGEGVTISQFYLAVGGDRSVRVRIRDGATATLTLKFGGHARERDEFEYEIGLEDARAMERFAVGRVIEKIRHLVSHGGYVYEVDTFKRALAGLVIAELETADDVPAAGLPAWLGREITGDAAYYSANLAIDGMPAGI